MQTAELDPNLVEGTDYISELAMWQNVDTIQGINKIASNVYAMIEQNIRDMITEHLGL